MSTQWSKLLRVLSIFERWPQQRWIPVMLPIAIVLLVVGQLLVANSFTQSRFPVSSYAAQFTFSGPLLKSYYAVLIEQGTMDAYVRSRWLDFVFIAGLLCTTLLAPIIYARLHPIGSVWRRINLLIVPLMPISPLVDAVENCLEFFMLANPAYFPDELAVLQSISSVVKYASGPVVGLSALALNVTLLVRANLQRR